MLGSMPDQLENDWEVGRFGPGVVFGLDQCDALAMHGASCKTRLTLLISFPRQFLFLSM